MVGLYWVPGHVRVRRYIVGLYWVPGHAGVRRHMMGLYWVPGHAGVQLKENGDRSARDEDVHKIVGPEPSWGFSKQNVKMKDKTLGG